MHHHRDVELAADQQMLEIVAIVLDRRDLDAGKARRKRARRSDST